MGFTLQFSERARVNKENKSNSQTLGSPIPWPQLIRDSIQRLITEIIHLELDHFLATHNEYLADGRLRLVKNGYAPQRQLRTRAGQITIKVPKIRDRSTQKNKICFQSILLPPYVRYMTVVEQSLPMTLLHHDSEENTVDILSQIIGESVRALPLDIIRQLKDKSIDELMFLSNRILQGNIELNIKLAAVDAYVLGDNIANTAGKIIYRNELMELIQYTAQTATVHQTPLLLITSWINKYYILDLTEQYSMVRWLVSQGITVFTISWVNPDKAYAQKNFFDYLQEGPLTAIKIIQQQLCVTQVNTLGLCAGGILQATLLAYNKARQDNSIKSATFLVSAFGFNTLKTEESTSTLNEQQLQQLRKTINEKGFLYGPFMNIFFNSLKNNDLVQLFFIKNFQSKKSTIPHAIFHWNADSSNIPAALLSDCINWTCISNELLNPGSIVLNNTPIDLRRIDIPTFFLCSEKDHLCPWTISYQAYQMMQGPKCFVLGHSGHAAILINAPSTKNRYKYKTNHHTPETPEEWLRSATQCYGSWWLEFGQWLQQHSGAMIPAPAWTTSVYPPIIDAPGDYVRKQCAI